ncbi:MAG: DNA recombination protein RmuC [Galbitalea sp.]
MLATALEVDPTLLEYAFSKKIALASPVNLWAVLKTVAFTWQQDVLTEDAKRLFDLSKELYGRLGTARTSTRRSCAIHRQHGLQLQPVRQFAGEPGSGHGAQARRARRVEGHRGAAAGRAATQAVDGRRAGAARGRRAWGIATAAQWCEA